MSERVDFIQEINGRINGLSLALSLVVFHIVARSTQEEVKTLRTTFTTIYESLEKSFSNKDIDEGFSKGLLYSLKLMTDTIERVSEMEEK